MEPGPRSSSQLAVAALVLAALGVVAAGVQLARVDIGSPRNPSRDLTRPAAVIVPARATAPIPFISELVPIAGLTASDTSPELASGPQSTPAPVPSSSTPSGTSTAGPTGPTSPTDPTNPTSPLPTDPTSPLPTLPPPPSDDPLLPPPPPGSEDVTDPLGSLLEPVADSLVDPVLAPLVDTTTTALDTTTSTLTAPVGSLPGL